MVLTRSASKNIKNITTDTCIPPPSPSSSPPALSTVKHLNIKHNDNVVKSNTASPIVLNEAKNFQDITKSGYEEMDKLYYGRIMKHRTNDVPTIYQSNDKSLSTLSIMDVDEKYWADVWSLMLTLNAKTSAGYIFCGMSNMLYHTNQIIGRSSYIIREAEEVMKVGLLWVNSSSRCEQNIETLDDTYKAIMIKTLKDQIIYEKDKFITNILEFDATTAGLYWDKLRYICIKYDQMPNDVPLTWNSNRKVEDNNPDMDFISLMTYMSELEKLIIDGRDLVSIVVKVCRAYKNMIISLNKLKLYIMQIDRIKDICA